MTPSVVFTCALLSLKLAMTIISAGPIRAETTRLFTEDEYNNLVAEIA